MHQEILPGCPRLDDEPAGTTEPLTVPPKASPLTPLPPGGTVGPRVEIVQGTITTTLFSSPAIEPEVAYAPPRFVRRFFLAWNWLFNSTLGLLLPGLTRPRGKRFLAVTGLGLLAASAYFTWKWWRP